MEQDSIGVLTETVTQANTCEPETGSGIEDKKSLPFDASNAPAPRTATGKQRRSRNALKNGIFSKSLILESESRAEYQLLLNGLRDDLRPQGTAEAALVESMAVILWRKRRLLQAENAEITKARSFIVSEAVVEQWAEMWDRCRAGQTAGGILRPTLNPYLVQEAINMLIKFRDYIKEFGFNDVNTSLLKKVYGVDHNGEPPESIYRQFACALLLSAELQNEPAKIEALKTVMIKVFNSELERLEDLKLMRKALHDGKKHFETLAAVIPQPDAMDRVVRYETHLGREFDRLLNQLERVQRMRRGQPAPPTLNVNVS